LVVIVFSSFRGPTFQKISENRRTADNADETDESKPNRVTWYAETVFDAFISNSLDDVINYCCRFCSHHSFLKLSKIGVSEIFEISCTFVWAAAALILDCGRRVAVAALTACLSGLENHQGE
jgi:hypothetical protein